MLVFLNRKQLRKMTGYRNHAAQAGWLSDNGYSFDLRRDGRPNVLIEQVRERQCKTATSKPGPDLSWLDKPS